MLMHQVKQLQNQLTKMHEDHNATIAQLNETFKQQLEFAKAESVRSRREAENTLIQLRAIIMASVIDDPVRAQQINEAFAAFEQTKAHSPQIQTIPPSPHHQSIRRTNSQYWTQSALALAMLEMSQHPTNQRLSKPKRPSKPNWKPKITQTNPPGTHSQ